MAGNLSENPDLPYAIPPVACRVVRKSEASPKRELMVSADMTQIIVYCEGVGPHRVPPVVGCAEKETAGDVQVHAVRGLTAGDVDADVASRPKLRRRIGTTQLRVEQPVGRKMEGVHG